jgi:alkylhydroperoxidase family enzyme
MATRTAIRQRLDIQAEAPDAWEAMIALDTAIGLDESRRMLVKLRASLINGCVYIDAVVLGRFALDAGRACSSGCAPRA